MRQQRICYINAVLNVILVALSLSGEIHAQQPHVLGIQTNRSPIDLVPAPDADYMTASFETAGRKL
jgi:hypothetical protein